MSLGPLYVLLREVSVQVLCPFLNWIVCLPGKELCDFCIYFRDHILVQDIIGKYVFPYGWFPFHFADVFFSHAEASYFDEVLFIYSSLCVPCPRGLWKYCCVEYRVFLPMFSSRNVMVSKLILKSFYLSWIYFCVWCKLVIKFHFLHVAVLISQHHLLKRLFLLHFMVLPPLSNINSL